MSEYDVIIKNTVGEHTIQNSFGEVKLSSIIGDIDLALYYSDAYASTINAVMSCKAENSDVTFENVSGIFNLSTNYGKISFFAGVKM